MNNLVTVTASPHPFKAATVDLEIEEGFTVLELLQMAQPKEVFQKHAYIEINGYIVPRNYWHVVKPKAGHIVAINIIPQGGEGKDPLRVLLTIAIVAATFAFAGPLGAAIVGGEALAIGSFTIASSAIGAAVIQLAGGLLINMIAPIRPASLQTESPSYFIDQARNRARPYAPIPIIFGRHVVVPPLGAKPVTEIVGGDQYLRMIVVWGYGPLRISDIKIGETPISEFDDVEIETREGRTGDAALTLYPNTIDQQNLAIDLTKAASWQTRRSSLGADELSVDITLPRGLARFDDKGKRAKHTVEIQVQYKLVGEADWESATTNATAKTFPSSWVIEDLTGKIRFEGARSQPIRHGMRWPVTTQGQYDVRIIRISDDETDSKKFSTTIWSALRAINDDAPINFPKNLAVSALVIRATDQLSGVVDELNAVVESEAKIWDGNAWVTGYTSNPASMYRLALQHPARRLPENDANIELDVLADFYTFCDNNGYFFEHILDIRQGIWDTIHDICAVGRASPTKIDNKFSVIVDTGAQLVKQHFTPVNSNDFKFHRSFANTPDGVKLIFANKEKDYKRDERIVYNDGKTDANSVYVPQLSLVGITDKDHVYKFGRFHIAQTKLRRELWTLLINFEYLVARRGSRVTVQHDAIAVGIASAHVIEVTENAQNNAVSVKVDVPIVLPKNISYAIKLRTVLDAHIVSPIQERDGEHQVFTFSAALTDTIEIGDLISVGEAGYVTIDGLITAIEPDDELTARISIVPYQPGIYNAETGTIPDFNSGISPSSRTLPDLTIIAVYADAGSVRLIGDVYEPGIFIAIQPVAHPGVYAECEIRTNLTDEPYRQATIRNRANDNVELGNVEIGTSYDLRLRWNADDREPGNWTEHTAQVVSGNANPDAPTNFVVTEGLGNIRGFGWTSPNIPDFAGVKIRYSTNQASYWDIMTDLFQGIAIGSPYETSIPKAADTYYFEIRSVDTAGNESISGNRIQANLSAVQAGIEGAKGKDGKPGNRGLAGYSNSINRTRKANSSIAANTSTEWYLSGISGTWSRNRILTLGGISSTNEALLKLISIGALVTLYDDTDNWADYQLLANVTFSGTGNTRRVFLSLGYVESIGVQPFSGALSLHFTPSGAEGTDGLDGLDGQPGNRGLAGYAKEIIRTSRATTVSNVNSSTKWHLSGVSGAWTGSRSLYLGGISAIHEALLKRIGVGALVTIYRGTNSWADYTLSSDITFSGSGASRVATIPLTYVESVGTQPTSGAIGFHFTPAGINGEDGQPGVRGLVGYSQSIKRTTRASSSVNADASTEWYSTGAIGAWTGNRTLTLGGITAAQKALLNHIGVGALVTIYDDAANWADYVLRSVVTFSGSRAIISLAYVESIGGSPSSGSIEFHFTNSGEDGDDGQPGNRGLTGYSQSIKRTHVSDSSANTITRFRWYLTGTSGTWTGNRTLTLGGISEAQEALLRHIGIGALVTIYDDVSNWADYIVSSISFSGTTYGTTRRAIIGLTYVESIGSSPTGDGSVAFATSIYFHFTNSGEDGIDGQPGNKGLTGYSQSISRSTRVSSSTATNTSVKWYLSSTSGIWTGNRTLYLGGVSAAQKALLNHIGIGALVTIYDDANNWADYILRSVVTFSGSRAVVSLAYVESIGTQPTSGSIEFHFTNSGEDGDDGQPGNRGLAGYSQSISRTTRANSSTAADASTEWYSSGAIGAWTGNRTLTLGGVTAAQQILLRRIGIGALVTIYDDAANWADYVLRSVVTFSGSRAIISLAYVESIGGSPRSGSIGFHFTPSGEDGQPGIKGLTGYSQSIRRPTRVSSSSATNTSAKWYLSGTSGTWTGNRTLTLGNVSAIQKALLNHIGIGALVTVYRDTANWADYTLSSISFSGSKATISLAYIESLGTQPTSGSIEFHFTNSGDDGDDGQPGNRGLAGYSQSIGRSTRVSSHTATNTSVKWYLSGATGAWVGNRAVSLGGISAAQETLLNRIGIGALVTLYRNAANWADYVLSSVSFSGTGASRRIQLGLTYVESVGGSPSSGGIGFHFTPSGEDGIDGQPGNRGLSGYSQSIRRTTRANSSTAADASTEWYSSGAIGAWTGNRTLTLGGVSAAQKALLNHIGVGALVTIYDDAVNWADYVLRSVVTFSGSRAIIQLAYVESIGGSPSSGSIEFHFTNSGEDGIDGQPGNRGLAGYSQSISRSTRVSSHRAANTSVKWYLSGATGAWVGNRAISLGGITETQEALLKYIGVGALVTIYDNASNWADYTVSSISFSGLFSRSSRRVQLGLTYVESIGGSPSSGSIGFHFTSTGNRGLSGYSNSITRTHLSNSSGNTNTRFRWYLSDLSDVPGIWSGNRTLTLGGISTVQEALLKRIGISALVTIYDDAANWADYTLRSAITFSGANYGSTRRATISLSYIESIGSPPIGDNSASFASSIEFHFTAEGDPASRGPGIFYVSVSVTQRNLLQATKDLTTLATTSLINLANGATPGDNLVGDSVRFTRTGFVKWYSWTGAQWTALVDFIGAETIVGLQAVFNTLTVNLARVTGTLTASHIIGSIFTVDRFTISSKNNIAQGIQNKLYQD